MTMTLSARRADPLVGEIEDVYRTDYRRFLRVGVAILGDREHAHDAVQETFAKAIQRRGTLRRDGSLEAWLWRTLVNHCWDVLRSRHRLAGGAEVPDVAVRDHLYAEHADLRAALAALPDRQRFMIFLRHYADLDYEQIAEITGTRRGTVAAALHAANATLRRTMEGSAA
jgi:RNA polymerase sigma factor (sigma-70 family)